MWLIKLARARGVHPENVAPHLSVEVTDKGFIN